MKKLFYFFAIAFATCILFTNCGNGSSTKANYVKNEYLGKFPSIFVERYRMNNELKEEMRAKSQTLKSEADIDKLQKEWVEKEAAIKTNSLAAAEAEWEMLRAVEVPFRFTYDDPDFKVISAMIEEADAETGALTINLLIEAKHDIIPTFDAAIKYVIVNKEEQVIFGGSINPFYNIQTKIGGLPSMITAGNYCCEKGSKLMLYCGSYDFTGFAEIVFTN